MRLAAICMAHVESFQYIQDVAVDVDIQAPGGRGPLVLRLGRVSIPAAVLISLCSSAELFQALRLDGNSFGRERQGSGPEGRPTFWEARRVGDAWVAGRDPPGGLLVGESLPC